MNEMAAIGLSKSPREMLFWQCYAKMYYVSISLSLSPYRASLFHPSPSVSLLDYVLYNSPRISATIFRLMSSWTAACGPPTSKSEFRDAFRPMTQNIEAQTAQEVCLTFT